MLLPSARPAPLHIDGSIFVRLFSKFLRRNWRISSVNNSKTAIETKVVTVIKNNLSTVSAFLNLGRDYLKELPIEEREKFLQSILARQGEPNRWLLLLKYENKYAGFAHIKIDKNERIGWGVILEFYIMPTKRRMGLGRTFFNLVSGMLQAKGVKAIWLLADSTSEPFWRTLEFKLTGEVDKETDRNIMIKSLKSITRKSF
jgi:N-acetylglutamate synthase-like GNAT family acetyltransferase